MTAPRHFLAIPDLSRAELDGVLGLAERMRRGAYAARPLAGRTLAMLFMKSSTRAMLATSSSSSSCTRIRESGNCFGASKAISTASANTTTEVASRSSRRSICSSTGSSSTASSMSSATSSSSM